MAIQRTLVSALVVGALGFGLSACNDSANAQTTPAATKQVDTAANQTQSGSVKTSPERKPASDFTKKKNQELKQYLDFANTEDFDAATKGFIATWPEDTIKDENGKVVWNFSEFAFANGDDIDTINPSLQRMAQLNNKHGLFKVADDLYQVRGFDLAVMTFLKGDNGWVIIDPLLSASTARAALKLINEKVEDLPVTGIIFTHSHIDHFGGVFGITTAEEIKEKNIPVIAPEGFFEHSISENVLAGNIMTRRAGYMYGNQVDTGPQGKVDGGLGKTTSYGNPGIVEPTFEVTKTGETHTVDGIDFEVIMANGSEAPSEFVFFFPKFKTIMAAEVMTHTIHNISTLRGARVRDASSWAKYVDESIQMFGDRAEIMVGSHHWPTFGQDKILEQLEKTRDMYKYVHDQTLRLANGGYTKSEISAKVQLPESLDKEWYNRGYYGTVSHNARATYDFYFGAWWDGNPANLNPLPPEEQGKKYVEAFGGEDKVMEIAQKAIDNGEYRWAVTLLNNVVFANPSNQDARNLEADAMEQLGYQAESGPWRNYYLVGAKELRHGFSDSPAPDTTAIVRNMPVMSVLESMEVRILPEKAEGLNLKININVDGDKNSETGQYSILLSNSVMKSYKDRHLDKADVEVSFDSESFIKLLTKQETLENLVQQGKLTISNVDKFSTFLGTLETFETDFGIVTP